MQDVVYFDCASPGSTHPAPDRQHLAVRLDCAARPTGAATQNSRAIGFIANEARSAVGKRAGSVRAGPGLRIVRCAGRRLLDHTGGPRDQDVL